MKGKQATQTIKMNLEYIANTIKNNRLQEQKAIIELMLKDTVEAIIDFDFTFKVPYVTESNKQHFQTYINRAYKYKAKLLADMEEITAELTGVNSNTNYSLVKIQKILNTNLYKNIVNSYVNGWKNSTNIKEKYEVIYAV